MKYEFPHITNISQVLPVIEGLPEFIVAERPGGITVVNYNVAFDTTFPPVTSEADAIRRECRGMIFDTATGNILHRRLHKFFNANERPETQVNQLDMSQPHVILEKLDGSMITPVMLESGIRWGTKMGVTIVALPVEEFVVDHPEYNEIARDTANAGLTPIFEWCSRQQRIVIDYPEESLVLIAIRQNTTGEYVSYPAMAALAADYGIPVVKVYPGTVESMQHLIDSTRGIEGEEGRIVRFDDGHMVKVKGEWYLQLHRVKDAISREKNVIEILTSGKVDDVKAFMLAEDLARVEVFEHEFWKGVSATAAMLDELYKEGRAKYDLKKDFAVEFVKKQDSKYSHFLFAMWDGKNATDLIVGEIASSCGSQPKVDAARWLFGCNWNYSVTE